MGNKGHWRDCFPEQEGQYALQPTVSAHRQCTRHLIALRTGSWLIYDAVCPAGENRQHSCFPQQNWTDHFTQHFTTAISTPLLSTPTQQFNNEYEMPPN